MLKVWQATEHEGRCVCAGLCDREGGAGLGSAFYILGARPQLIFNQNLPVIFIFFTACALCFGWEIKIFVLTTSLILAVTSPL